MSTPSTVSAARIGARKPGGSAVYFDTFSLLAIMFNVANHE